MANEEHMRILRQGVEAWNRWRSANNLQRPDLSSAELRRSELAGANLNNAVMIGAQATRAELSGAYLIGANLSYAHLRNADLSRATMYDANLIQADLRNADLNWADLARANLQQADLSGANLSDTDLHGSSLSGANLIGANLSRAGLRHVRLNNAVLGWTTLADVELATVSGLESVRHHGPSSVGVDTMLRFQGALPQTFLQAAGLPEAFIRGVAGLLGQPAAYFSCFISYSSQDDAFASQLYAGLQASRVRSWFAPEDMKTGDPIRVRIDESIRLHDKLLLVLSEHSVTSSWVEQEVETALERERRHGKTVLFPIRLDDAVTGIEAGWPALIHNTRHIGDFTRWKDDDAYQAAFERLLRDLKV